MRQRTSRAAAVAVLSAMYVAAATETGATSSLAGEYGTVWTTNRDLNNVTAFDAGTGAVVGVVPVGAGPIGVVAPLWTGKVYSSDEGSNQVSVIDRGSRTVRKAIPVGPRPHHLMASTLGDRVYVAEFGRNTVGVIDTASDTKVATFATSRDSSARAHAVWPSRDGRRVYATNEVTNDIAAIDARTGELLWNLPVGARPSEILVTLDDRTAYVTVRNEDKVKEVDLTVPRLTGREAIVGVQPDTIQLTPDQSTLVVALRGTPAQVSLVKRETPSLEVTRIAVPGSTTGHQWLSRTGRYTFVAVEGPVGVGGLAVIDNRTARPVAHYPNTQGGRLHGVFYDPLPPSYGA